MNKGFSIIPLAVLLSSCATAIPSDGLQNSDDFSNVGLEIQWGEEAEIVEEIDPETIDAVKELQQSFDAAVEVRDLMIGVVAKMKTEDRATVTSAIDAFSADIEALKYYVDTATYDELTNEEHKQLIQITAGIEEGMAVFGDILGALL